MSLATKDIVKMFKIVSMFSSTINQKVLSCFSILLNNFKEANRPSNQQSRPCWEKQSTGYMAFKTRPEKILVLLLIFRLNSPYTLRLWLS